MSSHKPGLPRLPETVEFPHTLRPVDADSLPEMQSRFGVGNPDHDSADIRYERLSAQLAFVTGYEHAHGRDGAPYTRQQWEDSFHKCLTHLNRELALGFAPEMVEVLTLCYTVLANTKRFQGEPLIESANGENTGVHSLHTLLQAQHVYQKALEENPKLGEDINFFRAFQTTCILLSVHDLGEMFGEAGALIQVANAGGNFAVKNKAMMERIVFEHGVKLAIQTVVDKTIDKHDFYTQIDRIKSATSIQNKGSDKTDEVLSSEVTAALGNDGVTLSPEAQKMFDFMQHCWDWVEEPKASRYPFIGYLASMCEHIQGTRHLVRLSDTAKSPVADENEHVSLVRTFGVATSYRFFVNALYAEGEVGWLNHFASADCPIEQGLKKHGIAWVYETSADFFRLVPGALFIDSTIKEVPLHKDGSAYTTIETAQRMDEIKLAGIVAAFENTMMSLCENFNKAAIPIGQTAALRENIVAMYERAIDTSFMPGLVTINGKESSMVLLRDRPSALTGVKTEEPLPEDAQKTIARLTAHMRKPG